MAANVLLVGGAGFLGSHVAAALRAAGHRIASLSRVTRSEVAGVENLIADRRDPAALGAVLEGRRFDFTVDLAAYGAGDVESLLLVPYAALGRYVLISSGQVYLVTEGASPPFREEDSDRAVVPEPPAGTEDHAEWRYGVGKRRAESALLALRASYGLRAHVLRLPIIQGAGDRTLRLWAWLERMLDGGPVPLPDDGIRPVRHLWAGDAAAAVLRMLEGPPPREAVYNVAPVETVTLREFLEIAARAAGVTPRFVAASWAEIDAAGIARTAFPYAGPWASVLDPARAFGEWSLMPERASEYLPKMVRAHLEARPASHPGYAHRDRELALAARLGVAPA